MTPEEVVEGVVNLVSLPEVCIKVNEMVDDPNCSAVDIGNVIVGDPSLSARLLRIVNSSYYGFAAKVTTVSRAVAIVGTQDLRNLILATSAVNVFNEIPNDLVNMETHWRHSVYTGILAKSMAKRCRVLHCERLFIAGLLHDIGKLVLYHRLPKLSRDAILVAQDHPEAIYEAERDVIGFTHAEVGAALAVTWNLPDSIRDVIAYHHTPMQSVEYLLESSIVHIANALSLCVEWDTPIDDAMACVDPEAWSNVRVTPDDMQAVLEEAESQFVEALGMILQDPAAAK